MLKQDLSLKCSALSLGPQKSVGLKSLGVKQLRVQKFLGQNKFWIGKYC